ncbi:hypothetical protein LS68_005365 [Helicobacter sp. MIT 05-5293]|uniref:hypothetical protein n=1 Tax=Helicobacter sp. MIT 05-5293 TaxID=1548149 RepID=UPI0010FF4A91|nr:hypothetical protein [Helicobacter sp. MIT 05-5293]TLD80904.1 hypothetical protein LS68_005365 [Helicobacter sp. MIT 05-5293]
MEKDKLSSFKAGICEELDKRVADKILEMSNLELLKKLINHAESEEEALAILALGTTWKHTGFHFDKRLERQSSEISYLAHNANLSFCAKSGGGGKMPQMPNLA